MKQPAPPKSNDVFDTFKDELLKGINCVQVGIIQSFDPENQTASIQIAMKKVKTVNGKGDRVIEDYPLLLNCPVMVLSGGPARVTLPVGVGDTCIVLFNDRQIDNWHATGDVVAPTVPRAHDKSDGMAIVGIRSMQNAITSFAMDALELGYGAGLLRVEEEAVVANVPLTAPELHAENGATGTFTIVNVVDGIVLSGS